MKAILEFNLPDDQHAHLAAVHASIAFAALGEVAEWFRARLKYGELGEDVVRELADGQRVLMEACDGLPDDLRPW